MGIVCLVHSRESGEVKALMHNPQGTSCLPQRVLSLDLAKTSLDPRFPSITSSCPTKYSCVASPFNEGVKAACCLQLCVKAKEEGHTPAHACVVPNQGRFSRRDSCRVPDGAQEPNLASGFSPLHVDSISPRVHQVCTCARPPPVQSSCTL